MGHAPLGCNVPLSGARRVVPCLPCFQPSPAFLSNIIAEFLGFWFYHSFFFIMMDCLGEGAFTRDENISLRLVEEEFYQLLCMKPPSFFSF